MGNIGPLQLLIVLVLVLLVFGTKRIRSLGSDLGGAIRDFRKGVSDDPESNNSDNTEKKAKAPVDATEARDAPSDPDPDGKD